MLRVCGANAERDALSSAGCWCGGLFCGRGGYKRSLEFERDARKRVVVRSYEQFVEVLRQLDLYDEAALHMKWSVRATDHRERRLRGRNGQVVG